MKKVSNKKLFLDAFRALIKPHRAYKEISDNQKLDRDFVGSLTLLWGVIFVTLNVTFVEGTYIYLSGAAPALIPSVVVYGFLIWYGGSLIFFFISRLFKKNTSLEKIEIGVFYLWLIWALMPLFDVVHFFFDLPQPVIFGAVSHFSWLYAFPLLAVSTYFFLKDNIGIDKRYTNIIGIISIGAPFAGRYIIEMIPVFLDKVLGILGQPSGYGRSAPLTVLIFLPFFFFLRRYFLLKITLKNFYHGATVAILIAVFTWTSVYYLTPFKYTVDGTVNLVRTSNTYGDFGKGKSRFTHSYTWTSSDYETGTKTHNTGPSYFSDAYVDAVDTDFDATKVTVNEIRVKINTTSATVNGSIGGVGPKIQGCFAGDTSGAGTYYCSAWVQDINGATNQTLTLNSSNIRTYSSGGDGSAGGSTEWNALVGAMTQNDNDVLVHSWVNVDTNTSNTDDVIAFDSVVVEIDYTTNAVVSASGTQTSSMVIPSTNNYAGGVFTMVGTGSSVNVTGITISEQGTVDAQNNLANIKLKYDLDTSNPYDCASESYGGSETQYGSTTSFNGANGTAAFTGSVAVSSTQAMCVYAVLDVGSGASAGQTIDIQIDNPHTQATLSSGSSGPTTSVAISGSSTLQAAAVVSTSGTQTSTMNTSSTANNVGGLFSVTSNGGSFNVTGVTISEQGTVDAQANLANIKLKYDLDTSNPYDCASESYGGSETQYGSTTSFNGANGTAAFTGSVAVSSTQTMCIYTILDVGSGASENQTVEIQIDNPYSQVVLSSGFCSSTSPVAISGTTTLQYPPATGSVIFKSPTNGFIFRNNIYFRK